MQVWYKQKLIASIDKNVSSLDLINIARTNGEPQIHAACLRECVPVSFGYVFDTGVEMMEWLATDARSDVRYRDLRTIGE